MRLSLGHTGSVRISVLGGNSTNNSSTNPSNDATVNAEEASEFLPSSQGGATWNYHEYHSSVHKAEEENAEPSEEDDYVPVVSGIIQNDGKELRFSWKKDKVEITRVAFKD